MQTGMFIFFAFVVGVVSSIHMPMNATVGKHVGSPLAASILFYLVAFITSLIIFLIIGSNDTLPKFKSIPPYLFFTGVVSAFVVVSFTFLIPILGARKVAVLTIAGSIVTASLRMAVFP